VEVGRRAGGHGTAHATTGARRQRPRWPPCGGGGTTTVTAVASHPTGSPGATVEAAARSAHRGTRQPHRSPAGRPPRAARPIAPAKEPR
jgi:hypothetical protein